jgi:hypothetical protein
MKSPAATERGQPCPQVVGEAWNISNWNFEFVSDFEVRISGFRVSDRLSLLA